MKKFMKSSENISNIQGTRIFIRKSGLNEYWYFILNSCTHRAIVLLDTFHFFEILK